MTDRTCYLAFGLLLAIAAPGAKAAPARQTLVDVENYRPLMADHRAFRTGDVLTVYVAEATRAKSQAGTDASSQLALGASLSSPTADYAAKAGLSGSTAGGAQTTRSGELRTQISVQVVEARSDGSLAIEGAQTLLVNRERQHIRLRGVVRPQDIAADNTVWSHRIANAEIELDGVGDVSASQRQSLIYRTLKWLRLL
ncbi:flagellar biosynthesis protein FlgH [Stenotrophomonas sp. SPM]|uniref:flagellar basal body L-ring protein FlgH n=1 Tax=Stenotrophomonas sp. SPM TaxID=2170735 RepID=UPI000DE7067C|nr:flagellar basal body L-ring protein FlgH [Stenotrophomonas sp. SPM]PWB29846.1 flagellar biosynthesis protein FlgH [Stenotrophomonas sp. SPM]